MGIVAAIAPSPVGHPVWHLVLPAVASCGVFVGLKGWERWQARTTRGPRTGRILRHVAYPSPTDHGPPRGQRRPERWTRPPTPIAALAVASAAASAIHTAVCPAHFREATAFGLFFLLAASLQAAWAILILRQPGRSLLAAGAVGNLAVVALWIMSRTVGVPIGPDVWRPEAATSIDLLATTLELAIIVGVPWFLFRQQVTAQAATVNSRQMLGAAVGTLTAVE